MAWYRIKNGAHVSKNADGSQKITRTHLALGYQPGDEFLESTVDLAAKDPARWEHTAGPGGRRAARLAAAKKK